MERNSQGGLSMVDIQGKYNTAKVFTDTADEATKKQIEVFCDQAAFEGQSIRVMPDCHAGKGCTIGTTMTIKDKVVPGVVGVDISCGMRVVEIADSKIDLQRLDKCIHKAIPHGSGVRSKLHRWADQIDVTDLRCWKYLPCNGRKDPRLAIGSLGSGNHFISVERSDAGVNYLIIHTGSRNLGLQVADYYQQAAYDALHGQDEYHKKKASQERKAIVDQLTAEGREKEISEALKSYTYDPHIPAEIFNIPFELCYVEGKLFEDYIHDMKIMQEFATLNRAAIADTIQCGMRYEVKDEWETIHNYIDTDNMILRKGAISAQKGEIAIIPMNMRDGSLIVKGKGNPDWNYSAPHGAGRLMSRTQAKNSIAIKDFKESMEGIYSTSVSTSTIDEAPQAYKPMDEIINNIQDTCEIVEVIKPIYNFKAS